MPPKSRSTKKPARPKAAKPSTKSTKRVKDPPPHPITRPTAPYKTTERTRVAINAAHSTSLNLRNQEDDWYTAHNYTLSDLTAFLPDGSLLVRQQHNTWLSKLTLDLDKLSPDARKKALERADSEDDWCAGKDDDNEDDEDDDSEEDDNLPEILHWVHGPGEDIHPQHQNEGLVDEAPRQSLPGQGFVDEAHTAAEHPGSEVRPLQLDEDDGTVWQQGPHVQGDDADVLGGDYDAEADNDDDDDDDDHYHDGEKVPACDTHEWLATSRDNDDTSSLPPEERDHGSRDLWDDNALSEDDCSQGEDGSGPLEDVGLFPTEPLQEVTGGAGGSGDDEGLQGAVGERQEAHDGAPSQPHVANAAHYPSADDQNVAGDESDHAVADGGDLAGNASDPGGVDDAGVQPPKSSRGRILKTAGPASRRPEAFLTQKTRAALTANQQLTPDAERRAIRFMVQRERLAKKPRDACAGDESFDSTTTIQGSAKDCFPDMIVSHIYTVKKPEPQSEDAKEAWRLRQGLKARHTCDPIIEEIKPPPSRRARGDRLQTRKRALLGRAQRQVYQYACEYFHRDRCAESVILMAASGPYWRWIEVTRAQCAPVRPSKDEEATSALTLQKNYLRRFNRAPIFTLGTTASDKELTRMRDKALIPLLENHKWYPIQHEGVESCGA